MAWLQIPPLLLTDELPTLGNLAIFFVPQFLQLSNGGADTNGASLTEQVGIERGV